MNYRVVFDVVREGLPHLLFTHWMFFIIPIIFIAGSKLFISMGEDKTIKVSIKFRYVLFFFFIFMEILFIYMSLSDYLNLRNALINNNCSIVEGIVTGFDPMPYDGHKDEIFVVNNGVQFRYSDFEPIAGFNNTTSHGGPIREGLKVRVHYFDNEIARLEVEDERK